MFWTTCPAHRNKSQASACNHEPRPSGPTIRTSYVSEDGLFSTFVQLATGLFTPHDSHSSSLESLLQTHRDQRPLRLGQESLQASLASGGPRPFLGCPAMLRRSPNRGPRMDIPPKIEIQNILAKARRDPNIRIRSVWTRPPQAPKTSCLTQFAAGTVAAAHPPLTPLIPNEARATRPTQPSCPS
jgi:hypothetical protein